MNRLLVIGICLYLVSWLLAIAGPAFAYGQGVLDFDMLSSGVGARPLGMGSAFTAVADNADSPFYNPAGLANLNGSEITTMQTRLSSDADQYYVSYVQPLGRGALGVSWIQIGTGGITQTSATTDAFNEVRNLGSFSYFSNAYLLSYGVKLTSRVAAGLTAKYLSSDMTNISGGQGSGYSIAPGLMIKPSDVFSIGLKVDELVNKLSWGTGTSEKSPPSLRLGVAVRPILPRISGLFAVDFIQSLNPGYGGSVSAGYEWEREGLSLRLGYLDQAVSAGAGFSSGGGSAFGGLSGIAKIDYAYVQQVSLTKENVHRISLSGKW